MKYKSYEKRSGICFLVFLLFFVEVAFILNLCLQKCQKYMIFQGVVQKQDLILFLVNDEQLKLFYQNQYIYVSDKYVPFVLEQVNRNVLQRDQKFYHEILLRFSFPKKKKENDVVEFSIVVGHMKFFEIFKIIWKGDYDGTDSK